MGNKNRTTIRGGPEGYNILSQFSQNWNLNPYTSRRRFVQTGQNTANYSAREKKMQRYGYLPVNSCTIYHERRPLGLALDYVYGPPANRIRITGNSCAKFGVNFSFGRATHPTLDGAWFLNEKLVVNKLRGKIQDMKINLAQAMGERKQTARLLEDCVERVIKSVRALKKGNIRVFCREWGIEPRPRHIYWDRKRVSKKWASLWLEYQYGWKPFFSDVYGSAETLAQQAVEGEGILRTKARASERVEFSYTTTSSPGYEPNPAKPRYAEYRCELKGTGYAYFRVNRTFPALGIDNPLLLAWELLPFSFVADWFLGVGNYLQGIDATSGCTVFSAGLSRVLKVKCVDTAPWGVDESGGWDEFERKPIDISGGVGYFVNTNRFDFTKFLTSVALVRTVFAKKIDVKIDRS